MAKKKKVVGSLVNELSFKIDKASWNQIDKFEKKLKDIQKLSKSINTSINIKLGKIGKDLSTLSQPRGFKGRSEAEVEHAIRLASLRVKEKENKLDYYAQRNAERAANKQQAAAKKAERDRKKAEADANRLAKQQARIFREQQNAVGRVERERIRMQRRIEQTTELARTHRIDRGAVAGMNTRFEAAAARYLADPMNPARLREYRNEVTAIGSQFSQWRGAPRAGVLGVVHELKTMRGHVITVLALLAAVGGKFAYDTTKEFQSLTASMNYSSGSAAAAGEDMIWLRGEAQRLGVDISTLAGSFVKLGASAKGKYTTDQVKGLITGFTEYASVVGATDDKQRLGLYALQNMLDKGQIMAEDLKLQLAEQIPGAAQVFAKAFGLDASESVYAFIEANKPLMQDYFPAIIKAFKDTARESGALETVLNSLEKQEMRMRNTMKFAFDSSKNETALANFTNVMAMATDAVNLLGKAWSGFIENKGLRVFTASLRVIVALIHDITILIPKMSSMISTLSPFSFAAGDTLGNQALKYFLESNKNKKPVLPDYLSEKAVGSQEQTINIKLNAGEFQKFFDVQLDKKEQDRYNSILNNIGVTD